MNPRTAAGAIVIIGYYMASVLGHLEVSLWLVQRRESELLGTYKLADFLPHAGALLLAAASVWQARRAWHGANRVRTLAAWAAWLCAVIVVDRFLIYSFPEYLHYPQYALLAWLIARFHDPQRTAFAVGPILLAITLLGIADEALQYTWITISYSNYLDFNDFLLNLLGGIAGLLLYYGFAPGGPEKHPQWIPDQVRHDDKNIHRYAVGRGAVPDDPNPNSPSAAAGRPTKIGEALDQTVGRPAAADGMTAKKSSTETLHSAVILNSIQDPAEQPSAAGGHETPRSRIKSGMTAVRWSALYGVVGFAWLGTSMLLGVAAVKVTSTDPERLHPIERQPNYNTWIPGPHAGRYYVLDPITGTLLLAGLGALASAAPIMRRRNRKSVGHGGPTYSKS